MKNKTFIESIKCAINGLIYALRTEKNYKYYTIITLSSIIINMYFKVSWIAYLLQLINTVGVYSAECINTAIEKLCDMEHKEIQQDIKIIKDVAASSVFCWGIAFFGCEAIMIIKAIISN